MKRVVYKSLRYFFAAFLLVTAASKLLDNRGFADIIASYELGLPGSARMGFGLAISMSELAIGILLLKGSAPRLSAVAVIVGHLTHAVVAATAFARGLVIANGGDFGVVIARPVGLQTIIEDTVFVALGSALLWASREDRWFVVRPNDGRAFERRAA